MTNLIQIGLYDLVWNHPPLPAEALLSRIVSPHARRTYQQAIELYYWRVERDPCQATPPAVADYLAVLLNCYPPRTAALHLRIIAELYDEGIAAGVVATNPVRAVPPPQLSRDPPLRVPTREQAEQLLPACRCHEERGRRERALCLTICGTAIHREEVTALHVADLRREHGRAYLSLPAAGQRGPAQLGLSDDVADALDAYLSTRAVADDSPLFSGFPVASLP